MRGAIECGTTHPAQQIQRVHSQMRVMHSNNRRWLATEFVTPVSRSLPYAESVAAARDASELIWHDVDDLDAAITPALVMHDESVSQ